MHTESIAYPEIKAAISSGPMLKSFHSKFALDPENRRRGNYGNMAATQQLVP